ncbi:MAG: oligosaccharide flippase family protein [Propionibacteriaceae bacterium]|jgi:PST family polysaccharide transporter|nr:oligosaccharide flippase family protein [Propionibacteriaceae bacterium]
MAGSFGSRGAAIMIGGQWIRYAVSFVALVVLSRLLPPQAYGVFAVAAGSVALAGVLGDLGMSLSALRAESLSHQQRSNLLWVSAGAGIVLCVFVNLIAGSVASLYAFDGLERVLRVLSIPFVLNGFSAQFRVGLNRVGRYGAVAVADTVSSLAGLIVGVVAALLGLGAMALALQSGVTSLIALVGLVAADPWVPTRPRRDEATRHLLSFGGTMWLTQAVSALANSVDSLTLGWYRPSGEVGAYSRGLSVARLPLNQLMAPLGNLAIPRAAAEPLDPGTRLESLVDVFRPAALVSALGLSGLVAAGSWAPRLILGDQWSGLATVLAILGVAMIMQTAQQLPFWVVFSMGASRVIFVAEVVPRLVFVASAIVCARWGMIPVCVCMVVQQGLMLGLYCGWAMPRLGISAAKVFRDALSPVAMPLGLAVAVTLVRLGLAAVTTVSDVGLNLICVSGWVFAVAVNLMVSSNQRRAFAVLWAHARTAVGGSSKAT